MIYGFETDSVPHASAALALYAMYKSREPNSPMMGKDTWKRFSAYAHGSAVKSTTMGEFVEHFCHSGKVLAIVPKHLDTGPVKMLDGSLIQAGGVYSYGVRVLEDDDLLPLIENETQYLTLLVRRRIQDEKLAGVQDVQEDDFDVEEVQNVG